MASSLRYGRTMQMHRRHPLQLFAERRSVARLLHARPDNPRRVAVDFQSERYFALIRNFRRTNWLLMYLFGASPALDAGFCATASHTLETFDADTLYRPYATSLRMSDLGYSNTRRRPRCMPSYDTLTAISTRSRRP